MINSVFICLTCVLLQGTTCRILFTSSKPHKRSNLIESRQTTLNPISNTDTESEESGNKSKNENSELEVFHNKLTTHVLLQSDSNDILSPDSSGEKSNEFDKTKTTLRPKSVSPNIGKLTNIKKTKGSRELVEINLFSSELNSETEDADDMFWSRPLSNKNLNKDSEEYFKKTSKKPGTPFPLRQGITSDSGNNDIKMFITMEKVIEVVKELLYNQILNSSSQHVCNDTDDENICTKTLLNSLKSVLSKIMTEKMFRKSSLKLSRKKILQKPRQKTKKARRHLNEIKDIRIENQDKEGFIQDTTDKNNIYSKKLKQKVKKNETNIEINKIISLINDKKILRRRKDGRLHFENNQFLQTNKYKDDVLVLDKILQCINNGLKFAGASSVNKPVTEAQNRATSKNKKNVITYEVNLNLVDLFQNGENNAGKAISVSNSNERNRHKVKDGVHKICDNSGDISAASFETYTARTFQKNKRFQLVTSESKLRKNNAYNKNDKIKSTTLAKAKKVKSSATHPHILHSLANYRRHNIHTRNVTLIKPTEFSADLIKHQVRKFINKYQLTKVTEAPSKISKISSKEIPHQKNDKINTLNNKTISDYNDMISNINKATKDENIHNLQLQHKKLNKIYSHLDNFLQSRRENIVPKYLRDTDLNKYKTTEAEVIELFL